MATAWNHAPPPVLRGADERTAWSDILAPIPAGVLRPAARTAAAIAARLLARMRRGEATLSEIRSLQAALRRLGMNAVDRPRVLERWSSTGQPSGSIGVGQRPEYFDAAHRELWDELIGRTVAGVLQPRTRIWVELAVLLIARSRRRDDRIRWRLVSALAGLGASPADWRRVLARIERERQRGERW